MDVIHKAGIQQIRVQDYVALHPEILSIVKLEGVWPLSMIRLEKAFVHQTWWYPVTDKLESFGDYFRLHSPKKIAGTYSPETAAELMALQPGFTDGRAIDNAFALCGASNYWHLLMDCLPKLMLWPLIKDTCSKIALTPTVTGRWLEIIRFFFQRMEWDMPEVVYVKEPWGLFTNSYFPGMVLRDTGIKVWNEFLMPLERGPVNRRLFVMRKNAPTRQLLNQDEIAEYLSGQGFICVDPGELSFPEQINLFKDAELVVGVCGAALTNLLFAPQGITFIELYSGIEQPFFQELAQCCNLKRYTLNDPSVHSSNHHQDFTISLDELKNLLDRVDAPQVKTLVHSEL